MESKNKKYPPQAFKFFLEQHVENVVKYYDDRRKQRMQLEQEMGETYISLAYVNLKQFVDLNVLDCCESAISALTRTAILQPGMASTWRLLGEAASLVSAAVTRVRVLSVLLRTEAGPEDSDVCTRAALVELSVRCYTKSLALEPRIVLAQAQFWNSLGLIFTKQENWALAQHCFIKSGCAPTRPRGSATTALTRPCSN